MFSVEFFIFLKMTFIMGIKIKIKGILSFVGFLWFVVKLVIVFIDDLGCDMFGIAFEKSVPEGRLIFVVEIDLSPVRVFLIVVKCVLVAMGCFLGCCGIVVVVLFLSEGGSLILHFISKNIL